MVAIYPILSLLVIFALSLLIIRIGSVALQMTGLSPEVASFQATSAFSGAGYTTQEAEQAVSTAGRRKIVKALIRLGSLGLISAMASLIVSFVNTGGEDFRSLVYVVVGVTAILLVARSSWFNRVVTPVIERSLSRATDLDVRDCAQLLGLQSEYRVAEIDVREGDWLADETLDRLNLGAEGVLVLGIRRDGTYVGAPGPDNELRPEDTVILYGKEDRLRELSERDASDVRAHEDAVVAHEAVLEEQAELVEE
ncbi:TrkA C-terminal domain-containing protein [Halorussus salinisoli]|uniref:TrkA C-terminal domain-containing protein n=1 Tax=Halorussus salinisoli TaxID=2558242 RepID=UPI0010C1C14A|nr:TrkA C-terminal domain-containing protein [Halorussus salinisoli]